ncbi:SLOG family protein [Methylobacterium hispanicum]|uniref:SLOG family protein n=1 Tax=Methylobacterium hispanicum TaxID=270350 RepID=UPI002F303401
MKVLVCGGRDLDSALVWNWMEAHATELCADALDRAQQVRITHLIQGGASGADQGAARWAEASEILVRTFAADWKQYGRAAGPLRNAQMLAEGAPDVVVAFPGGAGTADMVRKARAAGLPVVEAWV